MSENLPTESVKRHPKIKIMPAKRKHRIEMKAINEKCLPENYDLGIWEYFLSFHTSYVLYADSYVVGYCLCGEHDEIKGAATIASFAILPEYRNRGFGRLLIDTTIKNLNTLRVPEAKLLKKYPQVVLQVRVSNDIAISLYESLGFIKNKVLDRYYADGENGYEMINNIL